MRAAGALAAERLNSASSPQSPKTGRVSVRDRRRAGSSYFCNSQASKKANPSRTKEHIAHLKIANLKAGRDGPIRPTMMESGREQPSASPREKRKLAASKHLRHNRRRSLGEAVSFPYRKTAKSTNREISCAAVSATYHL